MATEADETRNSPQASIASVLLHQLVQRSHDMDALLALPLSVVHDLDSGAVDSACLDDLMRWLQRAQEMAQSSAQVAEQLKRALADCGIPAEMPSVPATPSTSATKQESTTQVFPGLLGVVTLRGAWSWGQWLSGANGHEGELGTCQGVWGNDCRWELHLLPTGLFAFRNLARGCWLTAEPSGTIKCDRQIQQTWEAWRPTLLPTRDGDGALQIALRSHHGLFMCQEPPGQPTLWPPQRWLGAAHRMANNILNVVADRREVDAWETLVMADANGDTFGAAQLRQLREAACWRRAD